MIDTVVKPKTKVQIKTERPRLHKVILVNDDFTPREFVVTVLKTEFRMTEDEAHKVMITAHRLGACVVAVFTKMSPRPKRSAALTPGAPRAIRCCSRRSRRNSSGSRSPDGAQRNPGTDRSRYLAKHEDRPGLRFAASAATGLVRPPSSRP